LGRSATASKPSDSSPTGLGVWKVPSVCQRSCQAASICWASPAEYRWAGASGSVAADGDDDDDVMVGHGTPPPLPLGTPFAGRSPLHRFAAGTVRPVTRPFSAAVAIGPSPIHDRGVFARRPFAPGDTIDRNPVLVVPAGDREHLDRAALAGYYYEWGEDGDGAVALGASTILNHSYDPNATYDADLDAGELVVTARRPIHVGDEITINYGGAPDCRDEVWFDPS